jgi:hypothetical protein
MEPLRMFVQLSTTLRQELLEAFLRASARREDATHDAATPILVLWLPIRARHRGDSTHPSAAGGPILSRRVRSDPPAQRDFADP